MHRPIGRYGGANEKSRDGLGSSAGVLRKFTFAENLLYFLEPSLFDSLNLERGFFGKQKAAHPADTESRFGNSCLKRRSGRSQERFPERAQQNTARSGLHSFATEKRGHSFPSEIFLHRGFTGSLTNHAAPQIPNDWEEQPPLRPGFVVDGG